ncbi:MAG: EAL domain-containing protein [Lachnospiraceae bacterium]|nr:EAL domain-containing protein [Lachnospiraceae bacterium]
MNSIPVSEEKFTKDMRMTLQGWQDRFCKLTGVYAFCMDENGNRVTEASCTEEDSVLLENIWTADRVMQLYTRVTESPIEDQAVEDTEYPNVRIAASAIKDDAGNPFLVWIVCAVITNRDTGKRNYPQPMLTGTAHSVTESRMFEALELLRSSMQSLYSVALSRDRAIAESMRFSDSERRMTGALSRAEAVTRIVSLLDSDEQDVDIMSKELEYVCNYLDISHAFMAQVHKGEELVDITAQWSAEGEYPLFTRTKDIENYWFLRGDTAQVITTSTRMTEGEREQIDEMQIRALAVMPILINNTPAFYACFAETRKERNYTVDDLKFMSDANRIMQSVITKRNQRNSLAASYKALESMLDNIGSSIYVRDVKTNGLLFVNRSLRTNFSRELRDGTLKELFEANVPADSEGGNHEIYHEARDRWYELYYTHIKWVDLRPVSLIAIYDITEKKVYQKRIEQQAYTDFLTGLYNRMRFERDLTKQLEDAKRMGTKGALMYIDLDDFKHINDGLGHQYGDILLKTISKAMSAVEGLEGSCYRMGGDEFVAIVRSEQYHRLEMILEDIQEIFSKPWYLKDADYYCTMSMGTVEFPTEGSTVSELIQKADIAMYEAKKSGKNRIARYSADINVASGRRLDMEKNMRDATVAGYEEFEIYFQPIVDTTQEDRATGAEALVRWNSKLGFISPGEFIPLAEYLGLIGPIGNHVLAQACRFCKAWNDTVRPDFTINVNLSVVQLLQPDIVDVVKAALEDSGLKPSHLTLEVTESLAINDLDRMKIILMNIKRLGVRLALDDFGTGYSSLGNIRALPFDIIKVDQNFVKNLAEDSFSQAFIRMIAELGDAIGMEVCVEGIETKKQVEVLEGMEKQKPRYIQGYYFSQPVARDQFERKYIFGDGTDGTEGAAEEEPLEDISL